jgi:transmembrane sensor
MSNVRRFPRRNDRYDEASRWIARLDKGLSASEAHKLQRWMAADPENAAVLRSMASVWDKMDCLSRLSDLFPVPARKPGRLGGRGLGIAAAILVAVTLAGLWAAARMPPAPAPQLAERQPIVGTTSNSLYETAVGEQSTATLPDGTVVVLNTNSVLRVEYGADRRVLTLERGEVNVRVVKDELRPLSVIAGDRVVEAVGTEFNVEIKDDQKIELVVTEGRVRVDVRRPAPQTVAQNAPDDLPDSSLIVSAGEELMLGDPAPEVTAVSPEDIEVKLSWRNGNLIFRGESLEEAVQEIGRYTSVEFVFVNENLRKIRVAGLFKAGDVDGLLAALRENLDIVHEKVDDQTVLLGSN